VSWRCRRALLRWITRRPEDGASAPEAASPLTGSRNRAGPGRRFQPGVSGNPRGRPKSDQTIMEMARAHCPAAISTLVEIMRDPKASPAARALAVERILDRGYGRPPALAAFAVTDTRSVPT